MYNREDFINERNDIFLKIGLIKANRGEPVSSKEKELSLLNRRRIKLYADFIQANKPCNVGDTFITGSAGGRKIKGVADDFFIRNGYVYIESYYPIIRGNKSSQKAYFSLPHKELKIVN